MARTTPKTQKELIAQAKSKGMIVGWDAIGKATGKNGRTLARYSCLGQLAIEPKKIGTAVALTPAQCAKLAKNHLAGARA